MRRLLEQLVALLDFLYLDPKNKFVASNSSGSAEANAWLIIAGSKIRWRLANDRGQVRLSLAPSSANAAETHFFGLTVVRQFIEGGSEIVPTMLDEENSDWLRENLYRVEALFGDGATSGAACEALETLLKENYAARDW